MSNVIYHWHHIIPRHAGGTDDPSNLVKLTIQEHAEAHRLLWEQHGRLEDKAAWVGLSGLTNELFVVGQELANNAKKKQDVRAKMSSIKKNHWNTPEYRKKMLHIRSSQEYKEKCRTSALNRVDDNYRCNLSKTIRELWQDANYRTKQRNALDESYRRIKRDKAIQMWSDPVYRAKMTEAQRRRRLQEKSNQSKCDGDNAK